VRTEGAVRYRPHSGPYSPAAARQQLGDAREDKDAPRIHSLEVTCLTSWYFNFEDTLTPNQLRAVAPIGAAVGRNGRLEVLAFGLLSQRRDLGPGIPVRILAATELGLSWELPEAIAECDVVHLLEPFSRAGETGLLLAKLHGKPVCASHAGTVPEGVGAALDLLALADAVVPPDAPPERLAEVYLELLTGAGEAAECGSSS
jgi:hypothetical protein